MGSTNLNMERMMFAPTAITYDADKRNTILDYSVELGNIQEKDRSGNWFGGPFSVCFLLTQKLFLNVVDVV